MTDQPKCASPKKESPLNDVDPSYPEERMNEAEAVMNAFAETGTGEFSQVPYTAISKDALEGLIEEFIQREGTDYGEFEIDLDTKKQQIRHQLQTGLALILFDHDSQTVTIAHKDQLA